MIRHKDTTGTEISDAHPAVILAVHNDTRLAIVIPMTSNMDALRFPYCTLLKKTVGNGLEKDSVAMIFQLREAHYSRFLRKMGTIDEAKYKQILFIIKDYLKIPDVESKK